MKQVRIHGPNDVRVDEVPEPVLGPRDALVRVAACGICGSDLGYIANGGLMGPGPEPMPLGHEFAGTVEAVGAEVSNIAVGTRVVVNPLTADNLGNGGPTGAFAPRVRIPNAADDGVLFPIPDSISWEMAALAEPLGVGLNGINQSGAAPGDKVAVFGAGPIGLASVVCLRDRGIEDIAIVDLSAHRLEIAQKLGAKHAIDASKGDAFDALKEIHGVEPIMDMPMVGSDVLIEASGATPVLKGLLDNAKAGATITVVGVHYQEVPVSFIMVMMKELHITGAMAYPEDWNGMIDILERTDLRAMVTHRFPLEEFPQALETARSRDLGAKILIQP